MIHVQAEVTVSGLPLSGGAQAVLQNTRPWTTCSTPGATEHLTYFLVVKVHMKICRHFSPFSYVQQGQRHEERFNLESRFGALAFRDLRVSQGQAFADVNLEAQKCEKQMFPVLTLVTGPVSLSLMQPCSMRLSDRHVIMNLLPSFSSNGRTDALSTECSALGLLRTCIW